MQTFLPYSDFEMSAKVLDYRRLGKQRVEAYQILNVLNLSNNINTNTKKRVGWSNHPAVLMWKNHDDWLKLYFNTISKEWKNRGYKHNMGFMVLPTMLENPPTWLGNPAFHLSHRSNLLRKNASHYRKFWLNDPDNLPYVWPIQKN